MKVHITEYAKQRKVPDSRSKLGYKIEPTPLHQVETETGEPVFKEFAGSWGSEYLAGPGLSDMTKVPVADPEDLSGELTYVNDILDAFVAGWNAAVTRSAPESPVSDPAPQATEDLASVVVGALETAVETIKQHTARPALVSGAPSVDAQAPRVRSTAPVREAQLDLDDDIAALERREVLGALWRTDSYVKPRV